jgi:hypothetical protein
LILLTALALQPGCSTVAPVSERRWGLQVVADRDYALQPICGEYRAPLLADVPTEGLVPVYLFGVNGASSDEINRIWKALRQNGFAVSHQGYTAINGVWIMFAVGQGVVKTQAMADRLFNLMCALQFEHVHLVHARYNPISNKSRMI